MAVIMLASASGAPGTTTSALGLALQWPQPVVLVDADRDAPHAITGGYLGGHHSGRGMMSILHDTRRQTSLRERLLDHSHHLDTAGEKLLVTGFSQPSASALFTAWGALGQECAELHHRGYDVLVDAGRVGAAGIPRELVRHADLLVMTARSTVRSLVGLAAHLPSILETVSETTAACQVGLGIIGPGRPYSGAEVGAHFDLPVSFELPWAPDHAAVISDAELPPRRFLTRGYVPALVSAAQALHRAVRHDVALRGAPKWEQVAG